MQFWVDKVIPLTLRLAGQRFILHTNVLYLTDELQQALSHLNNSHPL